MASYSHTYLAYAIVDGSLIPHPHPIFTGDVAYDIPNRGQEIPLDEDTNQRSFNSVNEVLTAVNDYCREHSQDPVEFGSFVIVEKYSVNQNIVKTVKSKTKSK